jgi:hypothetical protein
MKPPPSLIHSFLPFLLSLFDSVSSIRYQLSLAMRAVLLGVVCAGALAADVLSLVDPSIDPPSIDPAIDSLEIHATSRWLLLTELLVSILLCFGSLGWAVVHWPKYTGWVKTNETYAYQHTHPLSGTPFHPFTAGRPAILSLVDRQAMLRAVTVRPVDGKGKTLPTPPTKVRPNSHRALTASAIMLLLCMPVTRADVQAAAVFDRWYSSATNVTTPCQSECCAPDCKTTLPSKCVACCSKYITNPSDCNSCLTDKGCKTVPTPAPTPPPPGPGPAAKCFPEVWCEITAPLKCVVYLALSAVYR